MAARELEISRDNLLLCGGILIAHEKPANWLGWYLYIMI
jgi:hypothetical protein